jgi:hypothetical protein
MKRAGPTLALLAAFGMVGCDATDYSRQPASESHTSATKEQGQAMARARDFSMEQYAWSNRPLVVFSPSQSDERYQRQKAMIEQAQAGFRERDMVWIAVFGEPNTGEAEGQTISTQAAAQLRQRFDVSADQFVLLLIGKDTTVKRRAQSPVAPKTLFQQIDQMPMRRREMQRNDEDQ